MIVQPELTVTGVLKHIVTAPLQYPGIIPSILPLVIGAVVIELYFGKYRSENLGWNSSVANAVIWVATGLNLIIGGGIEGLELYASYALVSAGFLVGYMDFYHEWSSRTAFRVSSPGLVYPFAYVTVVLVKTGLPVTDVTLKASAVFMLAALTGFQVLKGLEKPAMTGAYQFSR